MLLKTKITSECGKIQPKIIFILLGIVVLLLMSYRYNSYNINSSRDNNISPITTQSAFKDLSLIRDQVDKLSSLDRRFQQAKPTQVFRDSSHLSEQIGRMNSIKSELIKLSVDDCLKKTKFQIVHAMQLDIDGFTVYYKKIFYSNILEAKTLMNDAYKQMNICQND